MAVPSRQVIKGRIIEELIREAIDGKSLEDFTSMPVREALGRLAWIEAIGETLKSNASAVDMKAIRSGADLALILELLDAETKSLRRALEPTAKSSKTAEASKPAEPEAKPAEPEAKTA